MGRWSSQTGHRRFFPIALVRSRRFLAKTVGCDLHRTGSNVSVLNGETGGVPRPQPGPHIIGSDSLDATVVASSNELFVSLEIRSSKASRYDCANVYENIIPLLYPSPTLQLRDPCELSKKPLEADAGRGDGDSDGVERSLLIDCRTGKGDKSAGTAIVRPLVCFNACPATERHTLELRTVGRQVAAPDDVLVS